MVNLGLNPASILGIALAAAGLGLYVLRSIRPELSRDHDIFFAAVGLVSGLILLFQGWRLDPILQFGQFLVAGSAVFFAVESIRLRGVATEQAKRNTPIVDDERPVSRVYRAELDDLVSFDQRSTTRRIRGSRDSRPHERYDDYWDDDYSDDRPLPRSRSTADTSPSRRGGDDWDSEPSSRPRKRRPSRVQEVPSTMTSDRREPPARSRDYREAAPRRRPPAEELREPDRSEVESTDTPLPRRKRKRPANDEAPTSTRRRSSAPPPTAEVPSADYVAYQPIDTSEPEEDDGNNERRDDRPETPPQGPEEDDRRNNFDY